MTGFFFYLLTCLLLVWKGVITMSLFPKQSAIPSKGSSATFPSCPSAGARSSTSESSLLLSSLTRYRNTTITVSIRRFRRRSKRNMLRLIIMFGFYSGSFFMNVRYYSDNKKIIITRIYRYISRNNQIKYKEKLEYLKLEKQLCQLIYSIYSI